MGVRKSVYALAAVEVEALREAFLAAMGLRDERGYQGRELANRCCADRAELIATAQVGSIRARRDPELLRSFLAGTDLTI